MELSVLVIPANRGHDNPGVEARREGCAAAGYPRESSTRLQEAFLFRLF